MAKAPVLSDIANINNAATTINSNNDKIEASFQNTLSLDGSTPNSMSVDFDLDSNDLLNVGTVNADNLVVDGVNLNTKVAEASTSATNAATSETNAATSATNASNSATAAAASATSAASADLVSGGTITGDLYVTSKIGIGEATPDVSLHLGGTDGLIMPVGTTAQRPTGQDGMVRFNSTLDLYEAYINSTWSPVLDYDLLGVTDISSAVSSVDFGPFDSSVYRRIEFELVEVANDTAGDDLYFQIGDGTTFTGNHVNREDMTTSATSGFVMIAENVAAAGTDGQRGASGFINVYIDNTTDMHTYDTNIGWTVNGGAYDGRINHGRRDTAVDQEYYRIAPDANNISQGKIIVKGYKHL